MADFTLCLGNKAYSSWSLRGWLACRIAGMKVNEAVHDMAAADWPQWVQSISPNDAAVWDHALLREWRAAADAETWIIARYETPT